MMLCHACGKEVIKGEGEIAYCASYMEVSSVIIHKSKECRDYIMTMPCYDPPKEVE